jgi:hypothetical protein
MSFITLQLRRDTAANWTAANPTLASGEFGLETDTTLFKIGDGATAWNALSYGGIQGTPGTQLLNGAVDPTTEGVNGDFYINTATSTIFGPKAAGTWPSGVSIIGAPGANGADGVGVPVGGTTGQALIKSSNTDYATEWGTVASSPGGSDTQVQFNDGGVFGGDAGLTFNKTSKTITLGGGTVTTSSPVIDAAQTWNASGTTFTGLKANFTDTASAAASLLMDLQVGSASAFNVSKAGSLKLGVNTSGTNVAASNVVIASSQGTGSGTGGSIIFQVAPAGSSGTAQNALVDALTIGWSGAIGHFATFVNVISTGNLQLYSNTIQNFGGAALGLNPLGNNVGVGLSNPSQGFTVSSTYAIAWDNGSGTADTILLRDAANTLALRNGTAAQTKRIYGTYTDASNYRRVAITMSTGGTAEIKPEGAGTGASGNVLHISGLPTSNPGAGILWNNGGTVEVGT